MSDGIPEPARRALRAWYRVAGRHDLPWRMTRDPYAVLVSEVMLQQTQVERVLPYWRLWMARWPDAASLAAATPAEVIQAWAGLGYNRRALNLHRAVIEAVRLHGGQIPGDPDALRGLPGVGNYTANAAASFAGEQRVAVVDTNIARVLARVVRGSERALASGPVTREIAKASLPRRGARDWNLALMDLGATICTARQPACDMCPVRRWCAWRRAGMPRIASSTKPASPRFEETARYARGRIVAALRMQPRTITQLREAVGDGHAWNIDAYLDGLERDGLVERSEDGTLRLPGDPRALREG